MKINENFNDMLSDEELNVDVNSMFEDTASDIADDTVDNTVVDDDKKDDKDDDINDINNFFDENIDDNNEVDSPDSIENSDENSSSNSAPSNFTAILAKDLMDQGIISSLSDEDFSALIEEKGEAEALRSLIKSEVDNASTAIKSDYDNNYQEYLSLIEGGVDKNTAGNLVNTKEAFDNIDDDQIDNEDNEDLRRDLITENYRLTTKFTDAKIKKLVDRSFELGEDIEEAKDSLISIKSTIDSKIADEKETAKANEAARTKQLEDSRISLKQSINDLTEILPGQKINKQTKDKMYDLITKPVEDKNGNTTNAMWAKRTEDPVEFDKKLAYLVQTGFFEKGKSWDKFKSVKTTNEASELDEFLANNTNSRTGRLKIKDPSKEARDMIKSTASILGR